MTDDLSSATSPARAVAVTGCYVYAVVAGDGTGATGDGHGIEPGGPVHVVTVGDISAVVSAVDLDAMREGGSAPDIAEGGWLANAVRAHERVVLAAFRSAPTVPLRFGIVHADESAVQALLTEHRRDFVEELHRISAAAEWSVRVYVPETPDRSPAADDDVLAVNDSADAPGDAAAPLSGTTYLLRQRSRRQREQLHREQRDLIIEELTNVLTEIARDVVVTPQMPADGLCGIFSAAYLVDRCDEHRLVAAIDEFSGEAGGGVVVDLTGPWPPYHFTTLRLEADGE